MSRIGRWPSCLSFFCHVGRRRLASPN